MPNPVEELFASADAARRLFNQLELQLQGTPYFLWHLRGPEHRIVTVEKSERTPFFSEALHGDTLKGALDQDNAVPLLCALDAALESGALFSGLEQVLRLPKLLGGEDKVVPLSFGCEPTRDRGGKLDGLLVYGFDLKTASVERLRSALKASQARHQGDHRWFETWLETSNRMVLPSYWQRSTPGASGSPATPRHRILVVDDNQDIAEMLAATFNALGQTSAVAHSGAEALALLPSFRPELCLLDLGMPGMDGYELAKRIRANPESKATLVAFSGYGNPEARERSRQAGFIGHLLKPIDIDMLQTVLTFIAVQH